jgi:hypothetical protein
LRLRFHSHTSSGASVSSAARVKNLIGQAGCHASAVHNAHALFGQQKGQAKRVFTGIRRKWEPHAWYLVLAGCHESTLGCSLIPKQVHLGPITCAVRSWPSIGMAQITIITAPAVWACDFTPVSIITDTGEGRWIR